MGLSLGRYFICRELGRGVPSDRSGTISSLGFMLGFGDITSSSTLSLSSLVEGEDFVGAFGKEIRGKESSGGIEIILIFSNCLGCGKMFKSPVSFFLISAIEILRSLKLSVISRDFNLV